jgi:hypothetical protein
LCSFPLEKRQQWWKISVLFRHLQNCDFFFVLINIFLWGFLCDFFLWPLKESLTHGGQPPIIEFHFKPLLVFNFLPHSNPFLFLPVFLRQLSSSSSL